VQQRLPSLLDPPIGFAHRGARAHVLENTLEAFALALRLGATGLESDVWLTADNVAVLDHDGVVRRWGRKQPISQLTSQSLPPHIPSLGSMLSHCVGDFHLSLDVKDPLAFTATLAAIREARPHLEENLWLCHPNWEQVAQWRNLTHAKLVDSTRLSRIKEGPERRAASLHDSGIDAINMHHTDWNGGLVTLFHRFNKYALGWDMQQEHVISDGLRMGLDGIFSDHTDRMMDAFSRHV